MIPSSPRNDAVYFASLDGAENRLLFRSLSNAIYAAALCCSRVATS